MSHRDGPDRINVTSLRLFPWDMRGRGLKLRWLLVTMRLLVTIWPMVRLRSANLPGGQDATDLRGLPVAVPVEDRVQVV